MRPAVVIGRSGLDLFLVPISSVLANTDFALAEWKAAGLHVVCGIKVQLATIEERLVVKAVGSLADADRNTLNQRLRVWLQL